MNLQESPGSATSVRLVHDAEKLVPAMVAAAELGVVRRTLARWVEREELGFPKPALINRRWYFRRGDLESFKEAQLRKAIVGVL